LSVNFIFTITGLKVVFVVLDLQAVDFSQLHWIFIFRQLADFAYLLDSVGFVDFVDSDV